MSPTPEDGGETLQDRITARLAGMTRAERQVAEYLRTHGREAIFATAEQIGAASGTSDATVVRTAKTLGYGGLLELRFSLARQAVQAATHSVELRESGTDDITRTGGLLAHVFTEATERLTETWRRVREADFEKAVDALAEAREVVCFGLGPSETAARYLALRLGRIGRRARATGATGFRLADDLLALDGADAVVLFCPSRLLGELEVFVDRAQSVGARVVLITDSLGPLFTDRVHVVLPSVHSPNNHTGETVTSQVLTDALLLAVEMRDQDRATASSELLTALRSQLIQTDSRQYVRRRNRAKAPAPRAEAD